MTAPKLITLIGQRAHVHRHKIRRDACAVFTALQIARDWFAHYDAAGEWPETINARTFDTLLGAAEGAADGLYHRLAFIVGEFDEQGPARTHTIELDFDDDRSLEQAAAAAGKAPEDLAADLLADRLRRAAAGVAERGSEA
jgi:hypothetical protein